MFTRADVFGLGTREKVIAILESLSIDGPTRAWKVAEAAGISDTAARRHLGEWVAVGRVRLTQEGWLFVRSE